MRRSAAISLVATILVVLAGPPVAAHAGPVQTSPGNLETVGGEVSQITLVFNEPLTDVGLVVTQPDGTILSGETNRPEPNVGRLTFSPLVSEGRYLVAFEVAFEDQATFEGRFLFSYDKSAPPPLVPSSTPGGDDGGAPGWLIAAGPAATLAVLAVGGGLLTRRARRAQGIDRALRPGRSRSS